VQEAFRQVSVSPHPRLWQLVAESALEALDLGMAEKALVKAGDYQGIQYVKRLRVLGDRMKQRAEVAVYFGRVDEAEVRVCVSGAVSTYVHVYIHVPDLQPASTHFHPPRWRACVRAQAIYREIDRKDLAIALRERMGDWSRVVQLVQNGGGDDKMLAQAWNKIGDYYADKFKWGKAAQYYSQAKSWERVAMCYFRMDDYDALERLIGVVPYGNRDFLLDLGHMLQTLGMGDAAVECYLKAGEPKMAIDCCVLLNHWSRAVALAEEHNFPQIEGLLAKQVCRAALKRCMAVCVCVVMC
jgi:WD repeat-containing protein 35